jgi:protein-disulfide isomerase
MFERRTWLATCVGLLLLASCLPAWAKDKADDLSSLKRDVEALKAGQEQIGKDVAAIKKLLQALNKPQKRREPVQDVDVVMDLAQAPSQGDANAPLTLVEMTDFQCPFCGRHANGVLPEIVKNYVATGKVRYVVRDFPLGFHKNAKKAAEATHCAESQGKYWEMHNLLFQNQKALDPEQLAGYATQLGLDVDAFKACLDSGKFAQKVAASQAEGSKDGVTGTPTVFLGRTQADGKVKLTKRITGALPYPVFKQTIDAMLSAKAGGAGDEAAPAKTKKAGS